MILVALGANLPSRFGSSPETLYAACTALERAGIAIIARSNFYRTAPVPASDQPDYYNAVIRVATDLPPAGLLAALHAIEAEFGRVRGVVNAPRLLDLDLLAYDDIVLDGNLVLPHPRLHERAFVLYPLRDIAPDWAHPVLRQSMAEMIAALPVTQGIARAEDI